MKEQRPRKNKGYEMKTVAIDRVAKVNKGGRRLRFRAMVVVGDKNGSVGVGLGRGLDTRSAVSKGERVAVKAMKKIQLVGDTIPHEIVQKKGASSILLRPAKTGTGIIAGSSVRTVLELAGIESVYGKVLGTSDIIQNTYCTFEALKALRSARVLKKMRIMRERVDLKIEMDKERKIFEDKKREKSKKEGKKNNNKV